VSALGEELLAALESARGRRIVAEIVTDVVRAERETAADDRLVDVEEAARFTGRSVAALYRAASRGTVPGVVRQGRRLLFRRTVLACNARS